MGVVIFNTFSWIFRGQLPSVMEKTWRLWLPPTPPWRWWDGGKLQWHPCWILSFCCVPRVPLSVRAPRFACKPEEAVPEHLALAFELDLARGVWVVGFLRDSFRSWLCWLWFIVASSSRAGSDSVRNIWRLSRVELWQTSNYTSL